MKRSTKLGALAVLILASTSGVTQADQIFNYTFTNSAGSVPGTVTGSIDLPDGNGTFAATHVFIDSYPAALGSIGTPPLDAATWTQLTNSWTVASGAITTESFEAVNQTPSPPFDGATLLFIPTIGDLEDSSTGANVEGSVVFTPQVSTPEPASLTLLASGFFAIGGFGLVRRRRSSPVCTAAPPESVAG